jgi:hypothetical protein
VPDSEDNYVFTRQGIDHAIVSNSYAEEASELTSERLASSRVASEKGSYLAENSPAVLGLDVLEVVEDGGFV